MDFIKYCFFCAVAVVGAGFEFLAKKFGYEEKFDDFKDWLKEDSAHGKMLSGVSMVVISLFILLCFYGCHSKPDL